MKEQDRPKRGINLSSKPTGKGCIECLGSGGWWLHLRRCAECGHIGCCDSSPNQHASKHAATRGHPVITSFEPGEEWFYDYEEHGMVDSVALLPPHSHPEDQAVPGPADKVPRKLQLQLDRRFLHEQCLLHDRGLQLGSHAMQPEKLSTHDGANRSPDLALLGERTEEQQTEWPIRIIEPRAAPSLEFSEERRHEMIACAAYLRAEQRGFAPGQELADWLAAERDIDSLGDESLPQAA